MLSAYPKEICALLSTARIVLHSAHRKRPAWGAFSFLAQMGQEKIFGNTLSCGVSMLP